MSYLTLLAALVAPGDDPFNVPITKARATAIEYKRPLVVFVGQPAFTVTGCVVCRRDKFLSLTPPAVVVYRYAKGKLVKGTTFHGTPPEPVIRERAFRKPGTALLSHDGAVTWWTVKREAKPVVRTVPMQRSRPIRSGGC